ncbi:MAG: hypothetical protein GKR94_18440 [Gammaproteobacteria bacterium]|nr:hypothetical protein [Gammaproteobacteria bacterium]
MYEHVGISDGEGGVFENSKTGNGRGLVSYDEFSAGKSIIDLGILPGSLPVPEIIERAKNLILDKKSYHLLTNNCEHFVRQVCGVEVTSPQVQQALFATVSYAIASKATDPKIKGAATGAATGAAIGAFVTKSGEDAVKNSLIGASLGLILGAILSK